MHVKGLKVGGTTLADIGMVVPEGSIVEIPHNLARRSKDLQAALDAGDVHPAPTKAAQEAFRNAPKLPPTRPPLPPRDGPARGPNPTQEVAELKRAVDMLIKRVTKLEGLNDALTAKVEALEKEKKVAAKPPAKKTSTRKKTTTKKADDKE